MMRGHPGHWTYRGVTIERSRVTGYYLARSGGRGLTADTLAGMRELIRECPS